MHCNPIPYFHALHTRFPPCLTRLEVFLLPSTAPVVALPPDLVGMAVSPL